MSAAVGLMPVAHSAEIVVVCAAVVGGCVGFLWFNAPPARVFMGDTGSLALGALLGTVSVMTRHEILLAVVGGVFVVEALSVMIQVAYFRKPAGVFQNGACSSSLRTARLERNHRCRPFLDCRVYSRRSRPHVAHRSVGGSARDFFFEKQPEHNRQLVVDR